MDEETTARTPETAAGNRIDVAMVLAAGLGTRMRPLTLQVPKPLISVGGKAMLDHVFARLRDHGITRAVVNMHWLADQIENWAARQAPPPQILLSDERQALLETGGGIRKALPLLASDGPFFVLNSDSFWLDAKVPALQRLQEAWDDARMDCLVLTVPLARAVGYAGRGDFKRDAQGRVRRGQGEGAEAFTGVYVVHPRLFRQAPEGAFSMNRLFDVAMKTGRMYAVSHDGLWLHVGTPDAIAAAEAAMAAWNPEPH
jgi:MurNAc alpha-1-phosphate uridylyltransferase